MVSGCVSILRNNVDGEGHLVVLYQYDVTVFIHETKNLQKQIIEYSSYNNVTACTDQYDSIELLYNRFSSALHPCVRLITGQSVAISTLPR